MPIDDPQDFIELHEPPEDFGEYVQEYPNLCSWELIHDHDGLSQSYAGAEQRILLQLINLTNCKWRAKRQEFWPVSLSPLSSSELTDFSLMSSGPQFVASLNISATRSIVHELLNSTEFAPAGFCLKEDVVYVVLALIIFPVLIVAIILGNLIVVVAIITDKRLQVCFGGLHTNT